jgi:hypothetical protein
VVRRGVSLIERSVRVGERDRLVEYSQQGALLGVTEIESLPVGDIFNGPRIRNSIRLAGRVGRRESATSR